MSLGYIYYVVQTVQISVSWRRDTITSKRDKDAVVKELCGSVIKIIEHHAVDEEIARFKGAQDMLHCRQLMAAWSLFFRSIPPNAVIYFGFLVMSGYVFWQISIHQRSVKDFLALVSFMDQLLTPLNSLSSSLQSMQNAFVNIERLKKTQEVQPTIYDLAGAMRLASCVGRVELDSVQFGTLKGITFLCEENTVTAVLSISVSEKKTPCGTCSSDSQTPKQAKYSLMAGMCKITSLRRHIGVLCETCELRDGTIMQNIKYGLSNPDNIPDDVVFSVCQDVNIHQTILKLPGGYGCQLGQKGRGLDVEEARRLDLARLLLQGLKIIILRQSLVILKGESEEELRRVFKAVSSLRTIILLDQRISAVNSADKIVFLRDGEVIESGNHTELLKHGSCYQAMWTQQLGSYGGLKQCDEASDTFDDVKNIF